MKLKKGDNVLVTAGKSKGEKGTIGRIFKGTDRIIVEGVNKSKRHLKAKSKTEKGSIVEREMPIHASNVMLIDPKTGTGTRLGIKYVEGKKGIERVRVAKKSGQDLK